MFGGQAFPIQTYKAGPVTLAVSSIGDRPFAGALGRDLDNPSTRWKTNTAGAHSAGASRVAFVVAGNLSRFQVEFPKEMPPPSALWNLAQAHQHLVIPRLALLCLLGARGVQAAWSPEWCFLTNRLAMRVPFEWKQAPAETPLLAASQLDDLVATQLSPDTFIANTFSLPPLHAVDIARALLVLARQMWQPPWSEAATIDRLRQGIEAPENRDVPYEKRYEDLAKTGSLGAALRGEPWVELDGERLSFEDIQDLQWSWKTVHHMVRDHVNRQVIRALVPERVMPLDLSDWTDIESDGDPALLLGLTVSLVRDAQEFAAFSPVGTFDVLFPEGLGLRAFNMIGMRLLVVPDCMLWRALNPDPVGGITLWSPLYVDPHLPRRLLTDLDDDRANDRLGESLHWHRYIAWINVVCAALWHDLHVAGESSFRPAPRRSRRRRGGGDGPAPLEPAPTPPPDVVVLDLPRRLFLSGPHEWGTPEERAAIHHRLHSVAGHLRRLATNWQRSTEAEDAAHAFGVVLPEGYTFVRPFVRGGEDGDTGQPTPRVVIRSRGLASLLSLGGRPIQRRPQRED